MKILVTYDMFARDLPSWKVSTRVTFPEGRDFTYEEVFEMIPDYDVLCSMFDFPGKQRVDRPCVEIAADR